MTARTVPANLIAARGHRGEISANRSIAGCHDLSWRVNRNPNPAMDRLQCKACKSYSMLPVELEPEENEEMDLMDDHEARFFTCHVCGDNWLTVRRVESGDCRVTFVHQMGLQPILKRTAHMATPVLINEDTVDRWEYFLGDETVAEPAWRDKLHERRRVLRSICSN